MALTEYLDFYEAAAVRDELIMAGQNKVVSGALKPDGTPVYFITDGALPTDDMREAGFEARNGKPMDWYQREILDVAKQLRGAL